MYKIYVLLTKGVFLQLHLWEYSFSKEPQNPTKQTIVWKVDFIWSFHFYLQFCFIFIHAGLFLNMQYYNSKLLNSL